MSKKTKTALKVRAVERTPKEQRALDKADAATTHNNKVLNEVWQGKKGRAAALMHEDEGGELKRVGWPDGYKPELAKSAVAHAKLFGRSKATPAKDAPPARRKVEVDPKSQVNMKGKITQIVANPKRAGSKSAQRFDLYKNGMTVGEFIEAGGTIGDVRWDTAHEFIKVQ